LSGTCRGSARALGWRGSFNGGNTNYDGFGRSASDNNSFFLYTWLAF
jgi:hypothetical protein